MAKSYGIFTIISFLCVAVVFNFCSVSRINKTVTPKEDGQVILDSLEEIRIPDLIPILKISKKNHIIVKDTYDLKGKNLILDDGYTLDFQGGIFVNGCITGNNTEIVYKNKPIFEKVSIIGTWKVEKISTDMFKDLNYVQSLTDVLALTNAQVQNNVIIKDYGYDYRVDVTCVGMFEAPLMIKSNTELQLDGNIILIPTNLYQYVIMMVRDSRNVRIFGKGSILGDMFGHDYSTDEEHKAWKSHEWGHGIRISQSQNVTITGISVNNCTGDSYNIVEGSQHIVIDSIKAKGSRRQGVTIGDASNVTIMNSYFEGIAKQNGTSPGSAIDIEPNNTECEVKNIIIDGCEIKNCRQGVISWSYGYGNTWTEMSKGKIVEHKDKRHYLNLKVTNCQIEGVDYAFSLYGWDKAVVRGCRVVNSIYFSKVPKNTIFESNDIESDNLMKNGAMLYNCVIRDNSINVKNRTIIRLHESEYVNNAYVGSTRVIVQED